MIRGWERWYSVESVRVEKSLKKRMWTDRASIHIRFLTGERTGRYERLKLRTTRMTIAISKITAGVGKPLKSFTRTCEMLAPIK